MARFNRFERDERFDDEMNEEIGGIGPMGRRSRFERTLHDEDDFDTGTEEEFDDDDVTSMYGDDGDDFGDDDDFDSIGEEDDDDSDDDSDDDDDDSDDDDDTNEELDDIDGDEWDSGHDVSANVDGMAEAEDDDVLDQIDTDAEVYDEWDDFGDDSDSELNEPGDGFGSGSTSERAYRRMRNRVSMLRERYLEALEILCEAKKGGKAPKAVHTSTGKTFKAKSRAAQKGMFAAWHGYYGGHNKSKKAKGQKKSTGQKSTKQFGNRGKNIKAGQRGAKKKTPVSQRRGSATRKRQNASYEYIGIPRNRVNESVSDRRIRTLADAASRDSYMAALDDYRATLIAQNPILEAHSRALEACETKSQISEVASSILRESVKRRRTEDTDTNTNTNNRTGRSGVDIIRSILRD
jgi:hypothetical protein